MSIPTAYIVMALVIPLVAYFGFSAGQKALDVYRLSQEADLTRAETEALKDENARLRKQIEYLSSDGYVEKVAREELNLIKPGDRAVVVLADGRQWEGGVPGDIVAEAKAEMPNWLKWWDFFFGEHR